MLWMLCMGLALAGGGWRGDGTSVFAADPPTEFSPSNGALWSTPTRAWGNGSPVRFAGSICVTAEPTTVLCLDEMTGTERWRATNDYVDTVPAPDRAAVEAKLGEAASLAVQLKEAQRAYSSLQRQARRGSSEEDLSSKLAEASAGLDAMKVKLDETAAWRTPADKEIIGYASATPLVDGGALYMLTGHGVVSRFDASGGRSWSVWLGPHEHRMRGYDNGSTASPVMAGGVLVVGYGSLMGLDPATGAVKWKGPSYKDYGTPAVAEVGGTAVLITPDGLLVRASDGTVLQRDLGETWYVGPTVVGQDVYFVGGKSTGHGNNGAGVQAHGWRLEGSGGQVKATKRWSSSVPTKETFYASPVVHDERIYALSHRGQFYVLRTSDGGLVYEKDLSDRMRSDVFPSPFVAGDKVYLGSKSGEFVVVRTGDVFEEIGSGTTGGGRASPLPVGRRLFVRGTERVYCFAH